MAISIPAQRRGEPHVALVTPSFFGYESAIAEEFRRQGTRTTVIDERPSNSSVGKALSRCLPALLSRRTRRHFRRVLADLDQAPALDLVVVVKAELVPEWFLAALRERNPRATFVFYAYDSQANSPRGHTLLEHFDHAFSFDRRDVGADDRLAYKPLFHTAEFAAARAEDRVHDLCFVGTVHSDRYAVSQQLFGIGGPVDGFYYSPARWWQALRWLFPAGQRRVPWDAVSFAQLTRPQVAQRFGRARAVIDVQRERQSGLTMRTFEALAAGAKLITTNQAVLAEPFYEPDWVYLLPESRADWDLDAVARFVRHDAAPAADALAPYSLAAWVAGFLALLPARPAARPVPGARQPVG